MEKSFIKVKNLLNNHETNIDFNDRVAIVTGGGRGLGRVYALELAKRGAKVVVNDFDTSINNSNCTLKTCADKVVGEIKEKGGSAIANYDTVTTSKGGLNIMQCALDSFGKIDILINNAGILRDISFAKMSKDDWKVVVDVHLNGAYNVTQPIFKFMKNNKYGRIIMTTSAAGLYGNFGQANYSAAKVGVIGMMNTIKIEGEKYNININSIAPISASRLTKEVLPDYIFKKAKPSFVSALVTYLSSSNCLTTGGLYNVGMGYINKVSFVSNKWKNILNNNFECSAEKIASKWGEINNMRDIVEYESLNGMFLDLLRMN